MNSLCLTKSLLYCATITCDKENYAKLYFAEKLFKNSYPDHKKFFIVPAYKINTKLSVKYWTLKTK